MAKEQHITTQVTQYLRRINEVINATNSSNGDVFEKIPEEEESIKQAALQANVFFFLLFFLFWNSIAGAFFVDAILEIVHGECSVFSIMSLLMPHWVIGMALPIYISLERGVGDKIILYITIVIPYSAHIIRITRCRSRRRRRACCRREGQCCINRLCLKAFICRWRNVQNEAESNIRSQVVRDTDSTDHNVRDSSEGDAARNTQIIPSTTMDQMEFGIDVSNLSTMPSIERKEYLNRNLQTEVRTRKGRTAYRGTSCFFTMF
mmetsp:Transcript_68715/g.102139  ORF Transcript_68715/g.102139 Transcript_68715/m.102139 type:complete len:263 (+) Transcript_68715:40-828(+)